MSLYQISREDHERLDEYIAELHESFAVDVHTRLNCLRQTIHEYNSRGFFEAEDIDVADVRRIDKARLILNRLSKNGRLDQILKTADNAEDDCSAAFLLGCLATDNWWIENHEDAVFEGWAHMEGREAGRPLAVAARVRQGKRSRRAVIEAASRLYQERPALKHNNSRTAALIEQMKIEALRKRDGTYLGAEAIAKHLRAAKRDDSFGKI
jgi:hypothetical protein